MKKNMRDTGTLLHCLVVVGYVLIYRIFTNTEARVTCIMHTIPDPVRTSFHCIINYCLLSNINWSALIYFSFR